LAYRNNRQVTDNLERQVLAFYLW